MKAVFLDFDTLGPRDIDPTPLTSLLSDLTFHATTRPEDIAERIADAEIAIVNKVRLDETILKNAKKLRLICLAATGTDNVALEVAAERGIAVCNIRAYCTPSVVQHVFALILALTHHLAQYQQLLRDGAWQDSPQFCLLDFPIRELTGKNLGIVGLGALGRGVAAAGQAFGMNILAARRPYRRGTVSEKSKQPDAAEADIERVSFDELIERAHVVSLHCPLNEDTHHLIDAEILDRMRRDALLINTARGRLIDSTALVAALKKEKISGAGIDVLGHEPPVEGDPLLEAELPNLIVTPHIAWAARESRQRALGEIAANIADFLNGGHRNRVE